MTIQKWRLLKSEDKRPGYLEESDPYADVEEDEGELEENKLVLEECHSFFRYSLLVYGHRVTRFVHVHTCYSHSNCGFYSKVVTISFSPSRGATSI